MRLWKGHKFYFAVLVFIAGLFVWSLFQFADTYALEGWRAIILPALCAYAFLRVLRLIGQQVKMFGPRITAAEAKRMEKALKDPNKGSQPLFDELVAEEGPKLLAHRASLWERAPSSLKAARELQQDIKAELATIDDIIGYAAKHRPEDKKELAGLIQYRKELEHDLERAAALIVHLRD